MRNLVRETEEPKAQPRNLIQEIQKPQTRNLVQEAKAPVGTAMDEAMAMGPGIPEGITNNQIPAGAARSLENIGQIYPVIETALSGVSALYGYPASGWAGIVGSLGGLDNAKKWQDWVANKLIYQPMTQRGQEATASTFYPLEKLDVLSTKGGDWLEEKTDMPIMGAIGKTGIQSLPILIPGARQLRRGKGVGKPIKPPRKTPEFKTTGEALKYGKKATELEAAELTRLREQTASDSLALMKQGKLQEASDIGYKSQLYRESLAAFEGKMTEVAGPIIKQRKWKSNGVGMQAPSVRKGEYQTVKGMNELRKKPLGGWFETPIRTFDQLGQKTKDLFYWPIKDAEYAVALERTVNKQGIGRLRKGISTKSAKRIGTHAIAQQKDGMVRLNKMGIVERPKLTPKEMAVYDSLRIEFESLYKRLNTARMEAGKDPFPKTNDYFTFMQDMTVLDRLGFNPVFTKAAVIENQFMHMKTTPFRFAKARGKVGVRKLELNAFDIYEKYSESAIQHIHMSPAIAKGREMLLTFGSKKGGDRWILKENKPIANKFLTDWLDWQAGQKPVTNIPPLLEKGFLKLNENLTYAILGASIRSAGIQPSAIINTYTRLGPKYTAKGIFSLLSPTKRRAAMETSKHLITRSYDVAVSDAMRAIKGGKYGKAKKAIGGATLKPLQLLDMETAKATFHAAHEYAIKEVGLKGKKAQRFADDITMKTQASAAPSDVAPIQRTPAGKSLTLFQTFVINEWDFLTKDVLGIKNAKVTNPQAFNRVLKYVTAATAINIFYEDCLGVNSPHPTPIRAFQEALEEGEEIPSATWRATKELAEKIPVIGGGIRYGKGVTGAPAEVVRDFITQKEIKAENIAKLAGIPGTAQIAKTIRARKRGESTYGQIVGQYTKKKKRLKGL